MKTNQLISSEICDYSLDYHIEILSLEFKDGQHAYSV